MVDKASLVASFLALPSQQQDTIHFDNVPNASQTSQTRGSYAEIWEMPSKSKSIPILKKGVDCSHATQFAKENLFLLKLHGSLSKMLKTRDNLWFVPIALGMQVEEICLGELRLSKRIDRGSTLVVFAHEEGIECKRSHFERILHSKEDQIAVVR